ncbi:hypothetical protein LJC61_04870 [Ruminococcaceae bacterium OttesenSCG-928-A16]|nr:hypothetical protein [Ruminococcaceae bacterium OttesenSCG-928-A16]
MVAESIAILAICALLAVGFMRSKFNKATLMVLPITVIPAGHLLVKGLLWFAKSGSLFGVRTAMLLAFANVICLGITCGIIVGLSRYIKTKKMRRIYLGVMVGYSVLIGWAYIFDTLYVFFK